MTAPVEKAVAILKDNKVKVRFEDAPGIKSYYDVMLMEKSTGSIIQTYDITAEFVLFFINK